MSAIIQLPGWGGGGGGGEPILRVIWGGGTVLSVMVGGAVFVTYLRMAR